MSLSALQSWWQNSQWSKAKFFQVCKDGGPDSPVTAYILFEIKPLATVALLDFGKGERENFHSHAFHALTWFLSGKLTEHKLVGNQVVDTEYGPSMFPKLTTRDNCHRVTGRGWALTFRGPWVDRWFEYTPDKKIINLTHGRKTI
jgi:hypothetical protein